ncbi:hypothetical protein CCOS865_00926 [Pseudomonas reidholzensis]|uniref:Plasmid pRiA4b Orf3-like domain-containing protein n=1 Tax=Pseudomonas reidholzensis TaxID=1785162 RepID=A0A383RNR3_9PSED|nr:plasmid pRiA4b ORF-3 family protein [Pseudomonas reidholzensis]SYX88687.1 hypothetical protein CCOS865_00926 [Pseudomonas reidholzensis]
MVKPVRPSKPAASLFVLRIELEDIEPKIWRRVVVPDTITLTRLHKVIQAAMGWQDCHLHEFHIGAERYSVPDPDGWGSPVQSEARKRLAKVLNGQHEFRYLYDFGDSWQHRIEVEEILPAIAYPQVPCCIDGANACPPEDVGGPWGYSEFVAAMADADHPDHAFRMEWFGEAFDATEFDCEETNEWVTRLEC